VKQEISEEQRKSGLLTGAVIAFLLLALPLAVWLDLTELSKTALRRQAVDLNSVITSVRSYYATNVVGRVLANPNGSTKVVHNYESVPGAIPIPATLSLELGRVIGAQQENITYRFVSDFPFQNRAPHQLDKFEKDALDALRKDPEQKIVETETSVFNDKVRLVAPGLYLGVIWLHGRRVGWFTVRERGGMFVGRKKGTASQSLQAPGGIDTRQIQARTDRQDAARRFVDVDAARVDVDSVS